MPQITTFLPIFLTQLILVRITHATCTHLPSGRCFVDCTDDVYKVVCESIDGNQLQYDLQTFAGLNTSFELHIWNSPGIGRLGATSFADVHDQIAVLELQNLENLELFPEVAALISLKDLTIGNSPKVRQFPIELIPLSVESLNFHATGIELFYADYTSGKLLPKVRYFRIHQQALTCSDQFFLTFPNLESIEIIECHINLGNLEDAALPFFTAKPLRKLVVTNNTFSSSIANFHLYIFDHIVSSLVVHESSDIEISENAFPIGKKTLQKFNQLSAIKRLSLRGSYFENYQTLENLFKGFNDLEYLDLGRTNIPIYKLGIFNGLPNLQILRLDGNHLQDIEERDFFQGLQANNFSVLDVSNNNLHGHIYGFEKWGKNLMHYDMSGNDVTKSLFTKRAQFFPKLRFMSEARNRRIFTNSSSFTEMKQLDVLDFSCNRFMNITRDFFNRLPPTLRMYNMSFCERKLTDRVIVAEDAFVGFPTIKELYFDRAFLRTNFFTKLQKMPPESAAALLVLHMAYNHIAYLHGNGTHFKPFINLEYLDLEANRMQSTGGAAFSPLKRLRRLNLAKNGIFSISVDDFRGLDSLEDLDISGNQLLMIAPGSFDMLLNLRGLFLHDNSFSHNSGPSAVFGIGRGRNVTHLSIGNLPYRCLEAEVFVRFPGLRWIYLNESTPLFVHMDPVLGVRQQMKKFPLHPWAELRMCDSFRSSTNEYAAETFLKVQASDPKHMVYQDLYMLFNPCFQRRLRRIKEKVENILCQ